MEKQATLKDIAKRAEVSVSTVSRVINGTATKAARPEVQDRIWAAVKELNYTPNTAAQMLKKNFNKTKLHTVACLFSRSANFQNDPFFSEISRAIESELLQLGCLMKYSASIQEYPQRTIETLFSSEKVDGVIVLGRTEKRNIDLIKKYNQNVVCVGLNKIKADVDQVICDGYEATQTALSYFAKNGAEEIYYLGESSNEVRYESYRNFMNNRGIVSGLRKYVIETPFSSQKAYENLKKFLAKGIVPKYLFCGNDLTALGAIKAINEAGLKIPKEISLISIDNIEMAQFSNPMLTTVSVPMEQLGKTAAKLIVEHDSSLGNLPMTITLPSTLVVRATTNFH